MKKITVVDYGIGNIRNVIKALEACDYRVTFSGDPTILTSSERMLLPGVGAFQPAMKQLETSGLTDIIRQHVAKEKPLLGICLGMQLLCKGSFEFGYYPGFGFFDCEVKEFQKVQKVPHMGWNQVEWVRQDTVTTSVQNFSDVYFVHSFYADLTSDTIGKTNYGQEFSSVLKKGYVVGMQFHPEKSQKSGLQLLKNFGEI